MTKRSMFDGRVEITDPYAMETQRCAVTCPVNSFRDSKGVVLNVAIPQETRYFQNLSVSRVITSGSEKWSRYSL